MGQVFVHVFLHGLRRRLKFREVASGDHGIKMVATGSPQRCEVTAPFASAHVVIRAEAPPTVAGALEDLARNHLHS